MALKSVAIFAGTVRPWVGSVCLLCSLTSHLCAGSLGGTVAVVGGATVAVSTATLAVARMVVNKRQVRQRCRAVLSELTQPRLSPRAYLQAEAPNFTLQARLAVQCDACKGQGQRECGVCRGKYLLLTCASACDRPPTNISMMRQLQSSGSGSQSCLWSVARASDHQMVACTPSSCA